MWSICHREENPGTSIMIPFVPRPRNWYCTCVFQLPAHAPPSLLAYSSSICSS